MKVLFLGHEATINGATNALLQIVKYIHQNHSDIIIEVLFSKSGTLIDEFKKICPTHVVKFSIFNKILCKLYSKVLKKEYLTPYVKYVKNKQIDCLYANTIGQIYSIRKIKIKKNIPAILHIHESECYLNEVLKNPELLTYVDLYITVSNLSKTNLIKHYSISENKIYLQYPVSIWVDRFLKNEIKLPPLDQKNRPFSIGMIYNNETWYKSTFLIPILVKKFFMLYPDVQCKFIMVGHLDSDVLYKLKYDLQKLGLEEKIEFWGEKQNPLEYHQLFDIYALMSREESFSLAAQEAAIMSTPIVGFQGATGAGEWIQNGAGILVPYLDLDKFAEALYKLLVDNELRESMGMRGKQIVTNMYYRDSQIPETIRAIKNICTKTYQ